VIDEANISFNSDSKRWPPIEVEIPDSSNAFRLVLYFAHLGADAPFLGFQVAADEATDVGLDPQAFAQLASSLPRYIAYARAFVEWRDDWPALVEALRLEAGKTRRGLPDTFYRLIAAEYDARLAAGERHPIKAIAAARPVDKSRASRWVKEARNRGYIEDAPGKMSA